MAALEKDKQLALQKYVPVLVNILQHNNVSDDIIPFIIAKMILETGWFTSKPFIIDNNPGGISWNDNYFKRPGASIGLKRPEKEREKNAKYNNYVHFINLDTAVKDYIRIISKTPGEPIKAKTATDFAARLKQNGYYKSTQESYTNTLNSVYNRIQEATDIASLIKKKNSLNMASLSPILIGLILGTLFFSKK
jgi:flagellum-specific peptidoglycan hydrolase FlgJ